MTSARRARPDDRRPTATGRRVRLERTTRETDDRASTLDLDGTRPDDRSRPGSASTTTCSASLAHHGLFDLEIRATGDLQVDEHHTVEDVALVLGSAFAEALGDRAGIVRFGDARVPMDEALASAVVDVGGRPYAVVDLPFRGERVGELPLQLVEHAIEAFARTAGTTRPPVAARVATTITSPRPRSRRSAGRSAPACAPDPRRVGVASTKGSLG